MRAMLAVLAAVLLLPCAAFADGDPASDYLVAGDVFLPYPPPSAAAQRVLTQSIAAVHAASGRVKVAVIARASDLGSVPSLYDRPGDYARFLGLELGGFYKGALLVVMPNGFGFYEHGAARRVPESTLAHVSVAGPSPDELARAAAAAVDALRRSGSLRYVDREPPVAIPLPAKAVAGKTVTLRYQATDDSGRARLTFSISAGSRRVAAFAVKLGPVAPGETYFFKWRVPLEESHHALAFCAKATDPSGNSSPLTCAKLAVG